MLREETQRLLMMIQGSYSNFKPVDQTVAINTWNLALADISFKQAQQAFLTYLRRDISGFAPTPGKLLEIIHEISEENQPNENEAWTMVEKALRNSTYNSESEFAKLPSLVQKAVGSPGQLRSWALEESGSRQVMASNFMRVYRAEQLKQKDYEKLPENLKALVNKKNENSYSAQIQQKNQEMIQITLNEDPAEQEENSGISEKNNERLQALKEKLR